MILRHPNNFACNARLGQLVTEVAHEYQALLYTFPLRPQLQFGMPPNAYRDDIHKGESNGMNNSSNM